MKPTDEQVKEFWERCGFTIKPLKDEEYLGDFYYYPDCNRIERYVDLTLDNLFRYAVPMLKEDNDTILFAHPTESKKYYCEILDDDGEPTGGSLGYKDPALALFWAIYEVIK